MEVPTIQQKTLSKEVVVGWISSLSEAYNMAIYSFIAPLLAPLLFQQTTSWGAVFFSYALLFLGYCCLYPAGALYYGLLGDKKGRRTLCVSSTLGLAIATGLMGILPYSFSHLWIYFLILIGAQNFFSGGEYHGSIIYSLEHGTETKHGLISSLSCLFAVFGLVAASGLATLSLLSQDLLWVRTSFLVGGLGGLVSYFLKTYCLETPPFALLTSPVHNISWSAFLRHRKTILLCTISLLAFFIVTYNFIFIFLPLLNLSYNTYEFSTFKSLISYGCFLLLSGLLADKIGLQKTVYFGLTLFSLLVIPCILFVPSLLLLQLVLIPPASLVIAPIHSWLLQQFPISERCRGIFFSSAIATSLFGGSTVPLCLLIFKHWHSVALCALYPLSISLVTGLIFWIDKRSRIKTERPILPQDH